MLPVYAPVWLHVGAGGEHDFVGTARVIGNEFCYVVDMILVNDPNPIRRRFMLLDGASSDCGQRLAGVVRVV